MFTLKLEYLVMFLQKQVLTNINIYIFCNIFLSIQWFFTCCFTLSFSSSKSVCTSKNFLVI